MPTNTVDTVVSNINIWEGTSAQIQSAISGGDMSENDVAFVTDIDFEDKFRFATMPSISSSTPELLGEIVQYIGPTTETYTNGYFYVGEPENIQYSVSATNSNLTVTVVDEAKLLRFLKLWGRNGSNSVSFIYYYNSASTSYYWIKEPGSTSSNLSFYGISCSGTPEVDDQIIINYAFSSYHWAQCDVQPSVDVNNVQEKIQYSIMPTASEDYVTKVVQYVGSTSQVYTQGCFYVCVSNGGNPETYSWRLIDQVPDNAILNIGTGSNTLINQFAGEGSDISRLVNGTNNTVIGYDNIATQDTEHTNVSVFGSNNSVQTSSVTVGKGNSSSQGSIVIGTNNQCSTYNSIVIGSGSSISIGSGNQGSIAIGHGAVVTVTTSPSIQLGTGTNVSSGTFQVFSYQVLSAGGYIPRQRLASNTPSNNYVLSWDSSTASMKWKSMSSAIATKEDIFRYSTMPNISSDPQTYEGTIVQYIGNTSQVYTQGYFYKGISDYSSFDAYIDDWISGGSAPAVVFDREKFINKVHPTSEQSLFRFLYDHGWDFYDEDSGTIINDVNIADYGISFNPAQSSFTTDDCVAVEHTVEDYGWERINVQPGTQITVDDTMSDVSTNPVQNAVITTAVNNKQDVFQYSIMPTASESLEGKIIQYVGASIQDSYQNGYFYRCIYDEDDDEYIWEDVGFAGGGSGSGQLPVYTTTSPVVITSKGFTINSSAGTGTVDGKIKWNFTGSPNHTHTGFINAGELNDTITYETNDRRTTREISAEDNDFEVENTYQSKSGSSYTTLTYSRIAGATNGVFFDWHDYQNADDEIGISVYTAHHSEDDEDYAVATVSDPKDKFNNEIANIGYVKGITNGLKFWHGTEAEYDEIVNPDPDTLYIIIPYEEMDND